MPRSNRAERETYTSKSSRVMKAIGTTFKTAQNVMNVYDDLTIVGFQWREIGFLALRKSRQVEREEHLDLKDAIFGSFPEPFMGKPIRQIIVRRFMWRGVHRFSIKPFTLLMPIKR